MQAQHDAALATLECIAAAAKRIEDTARERKARHHSDVGTVSDDLLRQYVDLRMEVETLARKLKATR